jgi:hypothetical protein
MSMVVPMKLNELVHRQTTNAGASPSHAAAPMAMGLKAPAISAMAVASWGHW